MTELTPVLPDPVRRRLYVLCLAIPGGNTQLTSSFVIIRFLLFGVTHSGAQKPHPVLFLNCGTRRCHGHFTMHRDLSFWEPLYY